MYSYVLKCNLINTEVTRCWSKFYNYDSAIWHGESADLDYKVNQRTVSEVAPNIGTHEP